MSQQEDSNASSKNQASASGAAGCYAALREHHEWGLAIMMSTALQNENYEKAAAIRDEVQQRREKGTLNESLVQSVLDSKTEMAEKARLAFRAESAA